MRVALVGVVTLLAACPVPGDECAIDAECASGDVCARDHSCAPPSTVRVVKVTWTIDGDPASAAACGEHELFIEFRASRDDQFGFQPVPCFTGQFTVDKLPTRFTSVELGATDTPVARTADLDDAGQAAIDLPLP